MDYTFSSRPVQFVQCKKFRSANDGASTRLELPSSVNRCIILCAVLSSGMLVHWVCSLGHCDWACLWWGALWLADSPAPPASCEEGLAADWVNSATLDWVTLSPTMASTADSSLSLSVKSGQSETDSFILSKYLCFQGYNSTIFQWLFFLKFYNPLHLHNKKLKNYPTFWSVMWFAGILHVMSRRTHLVWNVIGFCFLVSMVTM